MNSKFKIKNSKNNKASDISEALVLYFRNNTLIYLKYKASSQD